MMQSEITKYIAEISSLYRTGNATEHSYRPALQRLIESLIFLISGEQGLKVTNEPKRIACGAPDYIVTRADVPVGYIEAKDIGIDLNGKANKPQLDRYKKSLDNLIITDYLIFQYYENGQQVTSVTIGKSDTTGIKPDNSQFENFVALIQSFIGFQGQSIKTSEQLSNFMAAKARLMANIIETALNSDNFLNTSSGGSLENQLQGFKDVLIPSLTNKEFSDVYAQTIAYGLFAAKLNETLSPISPASPIFNRTNAAYLIPHSNPFLRKLFNYVAGFELDERIRWIVDELADLFNHVDINAIINEFSIDEHDPIIHFYETFLSQYDPALRKSRGVWYTPQPVVQFMVRAVDDILKTDFSLSEGLADNSKVFLPRPVRQNDGSTKVEDVEFHRVQILDPAAGTGTFLAEVVKKIYSRFASMQGVWQSYANEHLIPRVNGFEILMASYVMAHLKIDMLLQQTGYKHTGNERLNIYLTNSLSEARTVPVAHFAKWLHDEASQASRIKRDVPVMVVLGNPPYSGESQNSSEWINRLMNDYKKEPSGIRLQEKNSKWINDDYVKFIRFSQYFIKENGEGVLAFINNHSFLDNPTFRGMRYNLLKTFDKIYVLDLHGNTKKKETAPDGSKDENVFDIQQGVSINIFVKTSKSSKSINSLASVYHADIYGKRSEKYSFLLNNTLQSITWQKLELSDPQYFFAAKDFSLKTEYEKGFSVQELFPLNGTGIVSKRDSLAFQDTKNEIIEKVKDIYQLSCDVIKSKYKQVSWESRDGKVELCKSDVMNYGLDDKYFVPCDYRPFDKKWTYYTGVSKGFLGWPVQKIMQHFLIGENIGLMICRQQKTNGFYHCLVHKHIAESSLVSNNTSEIGYSFPLYLYIKNGIADNDKNPYHRHHNLNDNIIGKFSTKTGLQFIEEKEPPPSERAGGCSYAPIDVLDYIYAVLHSPAYRERYKEFLKIDFPRVPYPQNTGQFWQFVTLGAKLRRLHLLDNVQPEDGIAIFPVAGNNQVEKLSPIFPAFPASPIRVFINDTQYFDNVPPETWTFYIGGYQPAQKWIKDRKGKTLNFNDVNHYRKIIQVLKETGELMQQIDNISQTIKKIISI